MKVLKKSVFCFSAMLLRRSCARSLAVFAMRSRPSVRACRARRAEFFFVQGVDSRKKRD
jgi:hypothetical protein